MLMHPTPRVSCASQAPDACTLQDLYPKAQQPGRSADSSCHIISLPSPSLSQIKYSLIRLPQQALQTQQHRANIIHRTPFILQNIQAYASREIDIRVVDGCLEQHDWRRIGVGGGEVEGQF
jgi:hypothetical protein